MDRVPSYLGNHVEVCLLLQSSYLWVPYERCVVGLRRILQYQAIGIECYVSTMSRWYAMHAPNKVEERPFNVSAAAMRLQHAAPSSTHAMS